MPASSFGVDGPSAEPRLCGLKRSRPLPRFMPNKPLKLRLWLKRTHGVERGFCICFGAARVPMTYLREGVASDLE